MADIWYGNPIAVSCNSTVIKTMTAVMAAQLAKAVYTALKATCICFYLHYENVLILNLVKN